MKFRPFYESKWHKMSFHRQTIYLKQFEIETTTIEHLLTLVYTLHQRLRFSYRLEMVFMQSHSVQKCQVKTLIPSMNEYIVFAFAFCQCEQTFNRIVFT